MGAAGRLFLECRQMERIGSSCSLSGRVRPAHRHGRPALIPRRARSGIPRVEHRTSIRLTWQHKNEPKIAPMTNINTRNIICIFLFYHIINSVKKSPPFRGRYWLEILVGAIATRILAEVTTTFKIAINGKRANCVVFFWHWVAISIGAITVGFDDYEDL